MTKIVQTIRADIEKFYSKFGFKFHDKISNLICEFAEVNQSDAVSQNDQRATLYVNRLVSAVANKLSIPHPDDFPNITAMNDFAFIHSFNRKKALLFDTDFQILYNEIYNTLLQDSKESRRFQKEIRPWFKTVGTTPKKLLESTQLRQVSSNKNTAKLLNSNTSYLIDWICGIDKQGLRKPKLLHYYHLVGYGPSKQNKLQLDFSLLDFSWQFLNGGPFPQYSKFSEDDCVELEFYKQVIQLNLFAIISSHLDGLLNDLDLLELVEN